MRPLPPGRFRGSIRASPPGRVRKRTRSGAAPYGCGWGAGGSPYVGGGYGWRPHPRPWGYGYGWRPRPYYGGGWGPRPYYGGGWGGGWGW
ncbi:hypothetical protein [Methylocystis parvus]|uniref:hypothetical protein n=1 Tax=Methylocystis parvus TaxID=134 RepID=UPI003C72D9AE